MNGWCIRRHALPLIIWGCTREFDRFHGKGRNSPIMGEFPVEFERENDPVKISTKLQGLVANLKISLSTHIL